MAQTYSTPVDLGAQRKANLSRRRFLRGLGAAVALPAFESLLPRGSIAAAAEAVAGSAGPLAVGASGAPLRMAFVYFPNGAHQTNWWPTGEGKDFKLAKTMESLEPVKKSIQVLGGLDHKEATPGPDG